MRTVAKFRLTSHIALTIARGSVLDFTPSTAANAAIVNAANEGCLGGSGVDGAISNAGGEALFLARKALPQVEPGVRCITGDAKLSGPGDFGDISTKHVIHAVGPDYYDFDLNEYDEADALLRSAYQRTLAVAAGAGLKEVAFSLLSASVFRGRRSLKQVLGLGVVSTLSWAKSQQKESSVDTIVMCAFLEREANTLLQVAEDLGLDVIQMAEPEEEEKLGDTSMLIIDDTSETEETKEEEACATKQGDDMDEKVAADKKETDDDTNVAAKETPVKQLEEKDGKDEEKKGTEGGSPPSKTAEATTKDEHNTC